MFMGYPLRMYGLLEHHAALMRGRERVAKACGQLLEDKPRPAVVLILDDSAAWMDTMGRLLPDYDVRAYTDPTAGVQAAREMQPALVLIDLQWCGEALGYRLAEQVRAMGCPAQLVSGFGTDDGKVWGKADADLLDRIRDEVGREHGHATG